LAFKKKLKSSTKAFLLASLISKKGFFGVEYKGFQSKGLS